MYESESSESSSIERSKPDHLKRTAYEPRDRALHQVVIRNIGWRHRDVRLFRLEICSPDGIRFLPGQWLDVYVPDPNIPQAGGFTITSSPSKAREHSHCAQVSPLKEDLEQETKARKPSFKYLDLAVQRAHDNPVAAWLWQDPRKIFNKVLEVRVGGSFVFPPFPLDSKPLNKVVFIAGGVGVNPLMSMLSWIAESCANDKTNDKSLANPLQVQFLYTVRGTCSRVLFRRRIARLFGYDGQMRQVKGEFKLFCTRGPSRSLTASISRGLASTSTASASTKRTYTDSKSPKSLPKTLKEIKTRKEQTLQPPRPFLSLTAFVARSIKSGHPVYRRRISKQDIATALGRGKDAAAVYICGPPSMTDVFVELLTSPEESGGFGMDKDRVLFEKWW